ncbi:MAG TPA: urea amidolyase associated protein UAAP1 [Micropepsaceae bacterium]|nr:urea amidolyase associated protein UAAP1 [Micropepsaceae bacterium]
MSTESNIEQTPEFYRQRYMELKARGAEANAKRPTRNLTGNPCTIPPEAVLAEEAIPAGWYWPAWLPRGVTLRLINDSATPGVSLFLWNADDPSERFNPADTVKLQWTARMAGGKLLFSDMGRVLASITADSCGLHDCLAGGSTPQSNARKYGTAAGLRNTRDNFLLAAAKHGLGPRDVGPCITFFAPLMTVEDGRLVWQENALKAGDYVDLRAEMNLLVVVSNCPHPLSPGAHWEPKAVRAMLWQSPPPEADDFCRTASDEAIRGFENTDSFIGPRAIP